MQPLPPLAPNLTKQEDEYTPHDQTRQSITHLPRVTELYFVIKKKKKWKKKK